MGYKTSWYPGITMIYKEHALYRRSIDRAESVQSLHGLVASEDAVNTRSQTVRWRVGAVTKPRPVAGGEQDGAHRSRPGYMDLPQ